MNGKECLLAFADLGDPYIAAANETEKIRRGFMRQKKRRLRMLGAACGCVAVVIAVAAVNTGRRFRQTPAVIASETGTADRPLTRSPSADAPVTAPGFVPPETAPPSSDVRASDPEQKPETPSAPEGTQNQPTQNPEPSPAVSPAVDATTEAPEGFFEKSYQYSLNGSAYSFYIPGRVIEPDKVGEKIGDASVTAGWKYADGTMLETEQLRCEVYRIAGIDPETAICIRFVDLGDALTTEHYYVQLNALADLSAVSAYCIPRAVSEGEE